MLSQILVVSWLSLVAIAAPAPWAKPGSKSPTAPKAIYLITNDQSNAVAALPVAADGTLSMGTVTPIGGQGSVFINAATGQPNTPDALSSQSAVTRVGNVSQSTGLNARPGAPTGL